MEECEELPKAYEEYHSDIEQRSSSTIMNDEQEDPEDYTLGGYHPVSVGDLFMNRYVIIQKLGWGHFSTV